MTHEQVIDLLSMIAAFDQRTIGEGDVSAWHAVANAGGWTWDTARDAVVKHHTDSTDRIKPAHITQLIRADRRQPAPVDAVVPVAELTAAPPASAEARRAAMAAFTDTFAKKIPGGPVRPEERAVHARGHRRIGRLVTERPGGVQGRESGDAA